MTKIKSVAATIATLSAAASAQAAQTWDMPTAYPASNFQTVNNREFAACVADATHGDITIMVHPNGSLFKGNDIKRAVQTGQAQIGERLLSSHENESPLFSTDSIPFLAATYDDSNKLFEAARPDLEKLLNGQGLKLLYSVPWPPQGLYFKKDVNSVADMAGTKVRAYNRSSARMAELTKMTPVSIEAAEISQAMSAGVIDSLITSSVTGKDSKVWEQLNHFYTVNAWMPRNTIIVNLGVWNGLSKEDQAGITDCATKATAAGLEKSKAAEAESLAALRANGVQILPPSSQLASELAKVGETISKEWAAKAGDAGAAILERYKK